MTVYQCSCGALLSSADPPHTHLGAVIPAREGLMTAADMARLIGTPRSRLEELFLELRAQLAAVTEERDRWKKQALMEWCPFGPYREPHATWCICGGAAQDTVTWQEWHENQAEGYALVVAERDKLRRFVAKMAGDKRLAEAIRDLTAERDALKAQAEAAEADFAQLKNYTFKAMKEQEERIAALEADNARLREALADVRDWDNCTEDDGLPIGLRFAIDTALSGMKEES